MSKTSGVGWKTLSIDDSGGTPRAIKNDITNFDFSTPLAVQDVTGVDKSANERIGLLHDFSINLTGPFDNAATTSSHAVFSTVSSTAVARTTTLVVTGSNGDATLPNEVLYTDYALTRDASGTLIFKVPGVLADGTVPLWA